METLITNTGKAVRTTILDGREYLVANLTLINPGVLSGSEGDIFYPPERVKQSPHVWDGIPLVLRHPKKDGRYVPVNNLSNPAQISLGFVKNASFDGKLRAEGWFDVEATRKLDEGIPENHKILPRLVTGTPVELSTGLLANTVAAAPSSSYRGRPYSRTLLDYVPDHIAILPDETGACSISMGCGVLVNSEGAKVEEPISVITTNAMTKKEGNQDLPASAYAYVPDPQKPSTWKLRIDDVAHVGAAVAALGKGFRGQKVQIPAADRAKVKAKVRAAWRKFHKGSKDKMPAVIANAAPDDVSYMDVIEDVREYLQAKFPTQYGPSGEMTCYGACLEDVYNGFFVYEGPDDECYKQAYSYMDGELTTDGDPVKVEEVTTYVPVGNSNSATTTPQGARNREEATMTEREKMIAALVANCECWKGETEQALLTKLPDDRLEVLHKALTPTTTTTTTVTANTTTAAPAKPMTDQEWMASAPPKVQAAFRRATQIEEKERAYLVSQLVANVAEDRRQAAEQYYATKSTEDLERELSFRPTPEAAPAYTQPNWTAAAGGTPVYNTGGRINYDDILPLPQTDWAEEAKLARG